MGLPSLGRFLPGSSSSGSLVVVVEVNLAGRVGVVSALNDGSLLGPVGFLNPLVSLLSGTLGSVLLEVSVMVSAFSVGNLSSGPGHVLLIMVMVMSSGGRAGAGARGMHGVRAAGVAGAGAGGSGVTVVGLHGRFVVSHSASNQRGCDENFVKHGSK
jgi:hypothetical protein